MPSLNEAIDAAKSANLTPAETPTNAPALTPLPSTNSQSVSGTRATPMRCPLPASSSAWVSPDAVSELGGGSSNPQFRTFGGNAPMNVNLGGAPPTSTAFIQEIVEETIANNQPPEPLLPTVANASLTTAPLKPSQVYLTTVRLAKGFQLQSVNASGPCRVELYSTAAAQSLDKSRGVETGPTSSTAGLILDLVLLEPVLSWAVLDCVGCNRDAKPSSTIYATITNLSTGVAPFTVSFTYLPLES